MQYSSPVIKVLKDKERESNGFKLRDQTHDNQMQSVILQRGKKKQNPIKHITETTEEI